MTGAAPNVRQEVKSADLSDRGSVATIWEAAAQFPLSLDLPLREARDHFDSLYFNYHMNKENGNMTRVAKNVGLERTHLYRKLKQLDVKFAKKSLDEN